MDEIRSGVVSVEDKEPTVIKESIGTALVDGNSLIGKLFKIVLTVMNQLLQGNYMLSSLVTFFNSSSGYTFVLECVLRPLVFLLKCFCTIKFWDSS